MRTEDLPLQAFNHAVWQADSDLSELIHHSDRGSQYLSLAYTDLNCPRFCSDLYRRIWNMPRQYSPEFRLRALRLLDTMMEASDISEFEAIRSVAGKLGIAEESVRRWRRKAQVDAGERPGTTSSEHAEIRKLKRENAELRRANEVLKSASAFFAAELDRPATK
jgi:transposase